MLTTEMRILDLGCGDGLTPQKLSIPDTVPIVGLDVSYDDIRKAKTQFQNRRFVCGVGESLPFPDRSFQRVISNVALPYMKIPAALSEIRRVLVPGGTMYGSLHSVDFTLKELRGISFLRKPKAVLFRLTVLANGVLFHLTGRNLGESFQTERGMKIALARARFAGISFGRDQKRWFVEATRPLGD